MQHLPLFERRKFLESLIAICAFSAIGKGTVMHLNSGWVLHEGDL